MSSVFAALAKAAGATCDAVFSEGFSLSPRKVASAADPNGRRVADGGRQGFEFRGTFVRDGKLMFAQGRGKADDATLPIAAGTPIVDVATEALPFAPIEGDALERADTGERFKVTAAFPRDCGRTVIMLAALL